MGKLSLCYGSGFVFSIDTSHNTWTDLHVHTCSAGSTRFPCPGIQASAASLLFPFPRQLGRRRVGCQVEACCMQFSQIHLATYGCLEYLSSFVCGQAAVLSRQVCPS